MTDHLRQELARFLRTRRERVTPADVGLPTGPRRRTTHYCDMIAWNPATTANYTDFGALPIEQRNMVRWLLSPEARERLPDWSTDVPDVVARWHAVSAPRGEDRRLTTLLDEFSALHPDFRGWWDGYDVSAHRSRTRRWPEALRGTQKPRREHPDVHRARAPLHDRPHRPRPLPGKARGGDRRGPRRPFRTRRNPPDPARRRHPTDVWTWNSPEEFVGALSGLGAIPLARETLSIPRDATAQNGTVVDER